MNIEKSFTYPFEDKQWISKLGLGTVIALVPILNFAWSGYLVGIIRNVMNNAAEPLPTWDDLGKKFSDGLILFGATLVYALPALIALCLPLSIMAFSGLLSGDNDLQGIAQTLGTAGGVLFACLLLVFMVYGFALSILYPAILILFAREGTFGSCFKLREAFEMISRNAGPFFTAWAVSLAASFGVSLVFGFLNILISWIPCIGWIIGLALIIVPTVYTTTIYAHLFGQFSIAASAQNQLAPTV